jgi:hypothetical protein
MALLGDNSVVIVVVVDKGITNTVMLLGDIGSRMVLFVIVVFARWEFLGGFDCRSATLTSVAISNIHWDRMPF